jgi:hypothetical protein
MMRRREEKALKICSRINDEAVGTKGTSRPAGELN